MILGARRFEADQVKLVMQRALVVSFAPIMHAVGNMHMRRIFIALTCLSSFAPAFALTGNAPPANGLAARSIVMVVDLRGDLCTGTALTRELVLTAAHCVAAGRDVRIKTTSAGKTIAVRAIALHPRFDLASYAASRATADVALLKLAAPLDDAVTPASLAPARRVAVGETLTVAGFGVTAAGTARGLGVPRMATLTVTGKPGSLQIRLFDQATRNARAGLGACTGDSGAPAFEPSSTAVIGVVSWSTAPGDQEGCGGLTGVTPLLLYRAWIIDTARKFNSPF
jgi:secreted trypsin-like serine protease